MKEYIVRVVAEQEILVMAQNDESAEEKAVDKFWRSNGEKSRDWGFVLTEVVRETELPNREES